jgi:hypothetical protein
VNRESREGSLGDYFYFFMSLVIATVVLYGFGLWVSGEVYEPLRKGDRVIVAAAA